MAYVSRGQLLASIGRQRRLSETARLVGKYCHLHRIHGVQLHSSICQKSAFQVHSYSIRLFINLCV